MVEHNSDKVGKVCETGNIWEGRIKGGICGSGCEEGRAARVSR